MRAFCISASYCPYKADTGYCGYTGAGCAQGLVRSARYEIDLSDTIVKYAELSDETIDKIVEAVVERLRDEHTNQGR